MTRQAHSFREPPSQAAVSVCVQCNDPQLQRAVDFFVRFTLRSAVSHPTSQRP